VQGPHEPRDHDSAAIRIRSRQTALVAAAGALAAAPIGHAAGPATLPSPFFPLRTAPPLSTHAAAAETRFPGRLSSTQYVIVSVDSAGRPFRVVDVDRIHIEEKGDYSFAIAAPAEDVRPAAGSASDPGLRTGAVVWQGFSPGRRLLGAAITLRPGTAVPDLPLRIEIEGSELRLVNTTVATVTTVDADVAAVDLARALDILRAALIAGTAAPPPVVKAAGAVRAARVVAQVPVRVSGTVRFAGGPRRTLTTVVGRKAVRIAGHGQLSKLELYVTLPEPASVLRPPGAPKWLALARSGRLVGGRRTTRLAVKRLLAAGLALQFREFLANPDARGVTRTSYRYELGTPARAATVTEPKAGTPWLVFVGAAVGVAAAACAALVLWAHS